MDKEVPSTMEIEPFVLERYFARHEFRARHLLSPSDCETMGLDDLLALADDETAALWAGLRLGYSESTGHPLLRREIASLHRGASPGDVLVAAPQEGIMIAMGCLLRPGDRVVAISPAYQSLHSLARANGCSVEAWPVEADGTRWSVDLDRLGWLLEARPRLVVLNFPHNPTGFVPDRAVFERAVEMALASGARVFCDEMYRGLERGGARPLPSGCELDERVVSLGGLSKAYGLPGLRVGWLVTRDAALMSRFHAFKDYTTICGSAPSEVLAIMGLRVGSRIVARTRGIVEANLQRARRFLDGRPDLFGWMEPDGGSTMFPAWRGQEPVEAMCDQALREAGVMVVPGSMFGSGEGHFRIGLGREGFPEVLEAYATWLSGRCAPGGGP